MTAKSPYKRVFSAVTAALFLCCTLVAGTTLFPSKSLAAVAINPVAQEWWFWGIQTERMLDELRIHYEAVLSALARIPNPEACIPYILNPKKLPELGGKALEPFFASAPKPVRTLWLAPTPQGLVPIDGQDLDESSAAVIATTPRAILEFSFPFPEGNDPKVKNRFKELAIARLQQAFPTLRQNREGTRIQWNILSTPSDFDILLRKTLLLRKNLK
jgi:hypothetical protein